MRGKSCPLALCAIAIAMTMSTAVRAQNTAACVVTGFSAVVYSGGTWGHAPFSATVKTTLDQKLADGNAIHGSATTHQARDSAGRTMLEISSGCAPDQDGHNRPIVRVTVNDPANKTGLSWSIDDSSTKVVHVFHSSVAASIPLSPAAVQSQHAFQRRWSRERHSESLGSKVIAGVMAEGSRTVQTIPAGEEGNDLPLEIVEEVWIARDLGLAMVSIHDDPRSGRRTTEVEELNLSEPSPSLFVAPSDYKMEEQVMKPVSAAGAQ